MSYITTNSKIHFTPQEPKKEDIQIEDIAHALSYLCRANGHFDIFYSVAQHSINCALEAKARGLSNKVQLACLLHDASEAYISDVTRPVKKMLPKYQEIEKQLQQAIYEKYDIAEIDFKQVNEIDDALLYFEFLLIFKERILHEEPKLISRPDFQEKKITTVKQQFLELFYELTFESKFFCSVGIDGCKSGWMVAVLSNENITLKRYDTITEALETYKNADKHIIDIPIGLPETIEEAAYRPDHDARKILKGKASTIFPTPFRSIARAETIKEAWEINFKHYKKSANPFTMTIRASVNEVDVFLQENQEWKNVLYESHPELCFACFNNETPITIKKTEKAGIEKRLEILEAQGIETKQFINHPLFIRYSDDVLDAVCLALVGKYVLMGKSKTIPSQEKIKSDSTGLKMQMIIPTV